MSKAPELLHAARVVGEETAFGALVKLNEPLLARVSWKVDAILRELLDQPVFEPIPAKIIGTAGNLVVKAHCVRVFGGKRQR